MIRTLVFATICVAVFAQTDPPELHDLNNRVARDAGAVDVFTDSMQGMFETARKSVKDGMSTVYRTFNGDMPSSAKGSSDPSRNERRRRFAQQPPSESVSSTTPGQPPQPK